MRLKHVHDKASNKYYTTKEWIDEFFAAQTVSENTSTTPLVNDREAKKSMERLKRRLGIGGCSKQKKKTRSGVRSL